MMTTGSAILCRKNQQITRDTLITDAETRATHPVTPTLRIEGATTVTKWATSSTSARKDSKTEKRESRNPSPSEMQKKYVQIVARTTTQSKTAENPKITNLELHMMDSHTRR